jgi:hypothetical protein
VSALHHRGRGASVQPDGRAGWVSLGDRARRARSRP